MRKILEIDGDKINVKYFNELLGQQVSNIKF